IPPAGRSSFEYPPDSSSIIGRHRGARHRLVRRLVQAQRRAHFGRNVGATGALGTVIDGPRFDCDLETLGAELRRRRCAEQAVGIGADAMRGAATAGILAALLDLAIGRAVVLMAGVVLAGVGFRARLIDGAGRSPGTWLARIVLSGQIDLVVGIWLVLFELSCDVAVAIFLRLRSAMNFILILIAARVGQAQVEALLRGRLLSGKLALQMPGHVARAIHELIQRIAA